MKKYLKLLLLSSCLFTIRLFAQPPCTDEIVMGVKGKWTKRPDPNMEGQTPQIISRIDKMQQLLQAAYWMWDTQRPSIDFAKNIETNFNFKALQLMLDK